MPDNEARSERSLLAIGGLLVAIFAVGTFVPRNPDFDFAFGFDGYSHLGAPAFVVAALLCLCLLAAPGVAERCGALLSRAAGLLPSRLGPLTVVAAFGAAFWLLPNRRLSGDAGTVVFRLCTGHIHPSNALTGYLFRLLDRGFGLDPVTAIRATSCLAGLLYAGAALAIGRTCASPGPRRIGITVVLLTTGTVALFFGTIEVYAPVVAATTLYILFGLRWLREGKGRGVAPPLCLGVAAGFHLSALALLPSLLLLANRGRIRPLAIRRWLLWGALFLLPLLLLGSALFLGPWEGKIPAPGEKLYGTLFGAGDEGPLLPLTHSPYSPRQRYALLDAEHIVGVLDLVLLLAPVGAALFLVGRRPWKDPCLRFVAAIAAFLVLFPILWNVSYPLRRDWDLFALLGPSVALLGALAWFSTERGRGSVVRVGVLSLFCTLPFVLSNSLPRDAKVDCAQELVGDLEGALPAVATVEILGRVESRAGDRDLEIPGRDPREFRRRLGPVIGRALVETGVLERSVTNLDPERFRAGIRDAIGRVPEHRRKGWDPDGLADLLTRELAGEIRRIQDSGWATPAPGILAGGVVRRVMRSSGLGRVMPGGDSAEDCELFLLDILDEAMDLGPGYSLERPGNVEERLEPVLKSELRDLVIETGLSMSPDRWSGLLADAAGDVLLSRGIGGRFRKISGVLDAWFSRLRDATYPGCQEAYRRAEWVSDEETLSIQARNWLVERQSLHALERLPGNPEWLYLLARAVYRQGRQEEAFALFREAIRADPSGFPARLDLARALREAGRDEEALREAAAAVRHGAYHRRCPWALTLLAELRMERGERKVAASILRETLRRLAALPPSAEGRVLADRVRGLLAAVR